MDDDVDAVLSLEGVDEPVTEQSRCVVHAPHGGTGGK